MIIYISIIFDSVLNVYFYLIGSNLYLPCEAYVMILLHLQKSRYLDQGCHGSRVWMGWQSILGQFKHNLKKPIHPPACYWKVGGEPEGGQSENMPNITQTVTKAQDLIRLPGACEAKTLPAVPP